MNYDEYILDDNLNHSIFGEIRILKSKKNESHKMFVKKYYYLTKFEFEEHLT